MEGETGDRLPSAACLLPPALNQATADYYRDQLGFHYERFWNEPPSFCMVKRNDIVIMLAQLDAPGAVRPNRMVDPEGSAWDAYIWIDNTDALYAELQSKGVNIAREICDQIYGCCDFDVEDCNGYRWFWTTTISFRLRESIQDGSVIQQ